MSDKIKLTDEFNFSQVCEVTGFHYKGDFRIHYPTIRDISERSRLLFNYTGLKSITEINTDDAGMMMAYMRSRMEPIVDEAPDWFWKMDTIYDQSVIVTLFTRIMTLEDQTGKKNDESESSEGGSEGCD